MRVLAIETATNRLQIAVGTDAAVDVEVSVNLRRKHVESLTPAVESALAQCGATVHDLDLLVVDRGPGGFTGLRIGVATANALSFACGTPVVGVTSLEVLAASVSAEGPSSRPCPRGGASMLGAVRTPGPAGRSRPLPPAVVPPAPSRTPSPPPSRPTGLVAVGERAGRGRTSRASRTCAGPTDPRPARGGLGAPAGPRGSQANWATGTAPPRAPLHPHPLRRGEPAQGHLSAAGGFRRGAGLVGRGDAGRPPRDHPPARRRRSWPRCPSPAPWGPQVGRPGTPTGPPARPAGRGWPHAHHRDALVVRSFTRRYVRGGGREGRAQVGHGGVRLRRAAAHGGLEPEGRRGPGCGAGRGRSMQGVPVARAVDDRPAR